MCLKQPSSILDNPKQCHVAHPIESVHQTNTQLTISIKAMNRTVIQTLPFLTISTDHQSTLCLARLKGIPFVSTCIFPESSDKTITILKEMPCVVIYFYLLFASTNEAIKQYKSGPRIDSPSIIIWEKCENSRNNLHLDLYLNSIAGRINKFFGEYGINISSTDRLRSEFWIFSHAFL